MKRIEDSRGISPEQLLANAIIVQAAEDWRQAVRTLKKHPQYPPAKITRDECERFFKSEWIMMLTELDGNMILNRLEREEGIND